MPRSRDIVALALLAAVAAACGKSDKGGAAAQSASPPASSPTVEQTSASGIDPLDQAVILNYRLTPDVIDRTIKANENLAAFLKANPQFAQQLEGQGDQDDAHSLQQMVDRIDGIPPMKDAIASAGLSTRDWVLTTTTTIGTSIAFGMQQMLAKSGAKGSAKPLPPSVLANVQYYGAHQDQMTRLVQSMKALSADGDSTQ